MMKNKGDILIQRNFYPGDKWLYIKIYGNARICDELLGDTVLSIMNGLKRKKIVSQWFFIRYSDPEFHIRLRMELVAINRFKEAVFYVRCKLVKLCDSRLLSKYIIDTYSREIERYRAEMMELTETLFCIDSEYICKMIKFIRRCDENYRWMIGFYLIDSFLDCIGYDKEKKFRILENLSECYKTEFGYDEHNMKQLNKKYRDYRTIIGRIVSRTVNDDKLMELINMADCRNRKIQSLITAVKNVEFLNISSYMHMTMNRLFASQNRLHELVIYSFLARHYKSAIVIKNLKREK